jgi:hypothetical protein
MITGITVSVNYDNLLDIILPQNYKFFKTWYIVTQENDTKTLDVINKYNFDNVKVLFFDFYKNALFNKGGGIKYAQTFIPDNEVVLIIDSDIYIPDDLIQIINYPFENNTLYSCKRNDYYNYDNFINNIPDSSYPIDFMGFFQLYVHNKMYSYNDSENCRVCDSHFADKFPLKLLFNNIFIKHLGKDNQNHFGRKNLDDFIFTSLNT